MGKLAFVVLENNEHPDPTSIQALQEELERDLTQNRTIPPRWSIEKITVLDDP